MIACHIKWTEIEADLPASNKTGSIIDNPLGAGGVKFYANAEEVLAKLLLG